MAAPNIFLILTKNLPITAKAILTIKYQNKAEKKYMIDYNFTDTKFLTAKEKMLILKNWIAFLKSGLSQDKFTKRLYEHLHLHCGFIAHYDINGFYGTYFNGDYVDAKRFFSHFDKTEHGSYNSSSTWGDYIDIGKAMADEYEKLKDKIFTETQDKNDNRFELLKECIKRSETDIVFRNQLLNKIYSYS